MSDQEASTYLVIGRKDKEGRAKMANRTGERTHRKKKWGEGMTRKKKGEREGRKVTQSSLSWEEQGIRKFTGRWESLLR